MCGAFTYPSKVCAYPDARRLTIGRNSDTSVSFIPARSNALKIHALAADIVSGAAQLDV